MTADLVGFLRARLAREVLIKEQMFQAVGTADTAARLGIDLLDHRRNLTRSLHQAQSWLTLLDSSIVPYLSTAGPTGRIADQQLRILGAGYRNDPEYRPEWAPEET